MNINTRPMATLHAPDAAAPLSRADHRLNGAQRTFRQVLGQGTHGTVASVEENAVSTAEQLVAVSLVQPLLTQMRETSQAAPPFAPTQAEKQIRALQDAGVAQRIVQASRFPIVERLARGMLDRAERAGAVQVKAPSGSNHS